MNGSIECTVKPTEPGNPVYVYEPGTGTAKDGFEGDGPVMMAVEILPSEIPRESSIDFSRVLKQFLPHLATADLSKRFAELDAAAGTQARRDRLPGRADTRLCLLEFISGARCPALSSRGPGWD